MVLGVVTRQTRIHLVGCKADLAGWKMGVLEVGEQHICENSGRTQQYENRRWRYTLPLSI